MPWLTGRETPAALADDPEWRGRSASLFLTGWWPVGTADGATWDNGSIEIRVCWVDVNGSPVFDDADAVTIEPAHDELFTFPGGQNGRFISMGAGTATEGWKAESLIMPPRGRVSVRVTTITAAGADRAVIQYWNG